MNFPTLFIQGEGNIFLLPSRETGASIELKEDDVPILNNVVLALLAITPGCFHCCFRAVLLKGSKLHDLSHNETLLKVCVDPASCLWSSAASLDRPSFHLILSCCEKVLQLESFVSLDNNLVQNGSALGLLAVCLPLIVRLKVHQLLLEGSGEGDNGGTRIVLVNVLLDLWQPLVFLPHEVLLAQIDQVDH